MAVRHTKIALDAGWRRRRKPEGRSESKRVSENSHPAPREGTRPTGYAQNSNPLRVRSPDRPNFQTDSRKWTRRQRRWVKQEGTERKEGQAIKANQTKSNRIKPNQTCLLVCPPPPYVGGYASRCCGCATFAPCHGHSNWIEGIKTDQGESNQIKPNQTCEVEVSMAHLVAQEQNGVRRGFGLELREKGGTTGRQPQSNQSNPVKPE